MKKAHLVRRMHVYESSPTPFDIKSYLRRYVLYSKCFSKNVFFVWARGWSSAIAMHGLYIQVWNIYEYLILYRYGIMYTNILYRYGTYEY